MAESLIISCFSQKQIHSEKKSIIDFNSDDFQLKCECIDIEQADNLFAELTDSKISIDGLNARLMSTGWQNIIDDSLKLTQSNGVLEICAVLEEEYMTYQYRLIDIDFNQTPKETLIYYGF